MKREDGTYRKLRKSINAEGHAHELTYSCYKRLPLLSKDRTRQWFIEALQRARSRWHFELWAYVIMPEHAHVLLLPTEDDYDISMIVKAIKQPVARKALEFLRGNSPEWLAKLAVPTSKSKVEDKVLEACGGYHGKHESAAQAG